MRDFIRDGIITGNFSDKEKIQFTTSYLAKDVINHDDVLLILKSIYPSTYTEDGEEVVHEDLEQVFEEVMSQAGEPKDSQRLDGLEDTVLMLLTMYRG